MATDPELVLKRATRYFHKTGKFPFDQPGYDQDTGIVTDPDKPKRKHRRTRTRTGALAQSPTSAQLHSHTSTQDNRPDPIEYSKHKEHDKPITPPTDSDEGSDTSTERTPYWMLPVVEAEKGERDSQGITPRDYGTRWRSAYLSEIGEMPECEPGDHGKAEMYWYRIVQALSKGEGDTGTWTPAENNRLHLLERKWRKRKDGEDPWFEVRGTHRGGLTAEERERYEELAARMDINRRGREGKL